MSTTDTHALVRIVAIKIKRLVQSSKLDRKKSEVTDYVIPREVTELNLTS